MAALLDFLKALVIGSFVLALGFALVIGVPLIGLMLFGGKT